MVLRSQGSGGKQKRMNQDKKELKVGKMNTILVGREMRIKNVNEKERNDERKEGRGKGGREGGKGRRTHTLLGDVT